MCGLENTECRNMGVQRALSQQCHPQPCRVPLGRGSFPLAAPQSCPVPAPGAVLAHLGLGLLPAPLLSPTPHSPFHPAKELLESSSTTSTIPNYSNLLPAPLPAAFAASKEGVPDSCQAQSSAVTSQGAHRMHPGSGTRNCVCRGGQDARTICSIPHISKLLRALLEEPSDVSMEQPSGKVRGHLSDLAISSNLLLFMIHGLVVPLCTKHFPGLKGEIHPLWCWWSPTGSPHPSCSIISHQSRPCSPAAQHTEWPESRLKIKICLCSGWKLPFLF